MRTAFIDSLSVAAAANPNVMLLTGDLGFGVVQEFAQRFPNQFVNVGVAEQNMTGIAAGLAMSGRIVFTYSIANFPTIRPLEQIRNDVCYHRANVIVVSVGGGFAYGALGMSHHATEDLAMLRTLPELSVVAPGDPWETTCAVETLASGRGPAYLRLGRAGEAEVHTERPDWQLGKAIEMCRGDDGVIVTTGGMLPNAMAAAQQLAARGVELSVLSMHTVKPLDEEAILAHASRTRNLFAVEEHSITGGLGGACAEVLCEAGIENLTFRRLGIPLSMPHEVGSQEYLRQQCRLDVAGIVAQIESALSEQVSSGRGSDHQQAA